MFVLCRCGRGLVGLNGVSVHVSLLWPFSIIAILIVLSLRDPKEFCKVLKGGSKVTSICIMRSLLP